MTHSEEVLARLHEQVAEMCRYLEVPEDEMHDSWSLRDAIVELKIKAHRLNAELDFEYGVGSAAEACYGQPPAFKWESF